MPGKPWRVRGRWCSLLKGPRAGFYMFFTKQRVWKKESFLGFEQLGWSLGLQLGVALAGLEASQNYKEASAC